MDMRNMQPPVAAPPAASVRAVPAAIPSAAGPTPVAVMTPDVADLPFTIDDGVKVFNLIAEPVKQTIIPGAMGRTFDLWDDRLRREGRCDPFPRGGRPGAHCL